ncbi:MAG: transcriptional repressor NrdR [Clostridia bacterium]|nr:transcriptional repressor NrdR [Clostridia bacterium]
MKCPFCSNIESKVIDSRPTEENTNIRRRRECVECGKRFTTYEKVESIPLRVVKKDKSREMFDSQKLINGLVKACEKRPVSMEQIQKIVDDIENEAYSMLDKEITTTRIGERVMDELKNLDDVAYVRFASVYRQFKDIKTFMEELQTMLSDRDIHK